MYIFTVIGVVAMSVVVAYIVVWLMFSVWGRCKRS